MVHATPLDLSQNLPFLISAGPTLNPVWFFLTFKLSAKPRPEHENYLRADFRSRHFEAFVTYGNDSSNDYLGVISIHLDSLPSMC